MESTPEEKHKRLIQLLADNHHILKIKPTLRKTSGSENWEKFNTSDINEAVVLLVNYLHLTGGSVGSFDLYELLQSYFLDPEGRKEVNEVVQKSLSRLRKKNI